MPELEQQSYTSYLYTVIVKVCPSQHTNVSVTQVYRLDTVDKLKLVSLGPDACVVAHTVHPFKQKSSLCLNTKTDYMSIKIM